MERPSKIDQFDFRAGIDHAGNGGRDGFLGVGGGHGNEGRADGGQGCDGGFEFHGHPDKCEREQEAGSD